MREIKQGAIDARLHLDAARALLVHERDFQMRDRRLSRTLAVHGKRRVGIDGPALLAASRCANPCSVIADT